MFDKIQMILMMKTRISNNRISRLNNKLVHHVPVQYTQGCQSGPVNGRSSLNNGKYKPVDNNSLLVNLRENRNSSNKESYGVIKPTSKKEIMIVGDSMIKHVNGREVSRKSDVIQVPPRRHYRLRQTDCSQET